MNVKLEPRCPHCGGLLEDRLRFLVSVECVAADTEPGFDLRRSYLEHGIEILGELSVRPYNALLNRGLRTIRDLVVITERDLLGLNNFGQKSLSEVKDALRRRGLCLGMKIDCDGRILWPPWEVVKPEPEEAA